MHIKNQASFAGTELVRDMLSFNLVLFPVHSVKEHIHHRKMLQKKGQASKFLSNYYVLSHVLLICKFYVVCLESILGQKAAQTAYISQT